MKQRTLQVTMLALAVVVIGWIGVGRGEGADVVAAEAVQSAQLNTVTVSASGSIKVEPDVAYVNFAVEARGAKANEAQQANATKFAAVEKVLYDTYKIDKKDVKTTGFNVYPEYNYTEKDGQVLKGYVSSHSVQVAYRKLDDIGKLLDAVSAAGVNRVDGVQFSTEKLDQYELDALKKAMANASAKANVLASSASRQLKGVVNIVQGDIARAPIYYAPEMAKSNAMADGAAPSSSVQTGQIEVSTSVTVSYQMQ